VDRDLKNKKKIFLKHVLIYNNDLGNSYRMKETIVNWGLLGDHDGLRARLGI
jgi:hypothetical protein